MRNLLYFIFALLLLSCKESDKHRIARLTEAWTGKTVYYPADSVFESFEADSVRKYSLKRTEYTVVTYIDSLQCASNRLRLEECKSFLQALRPAAKGRVTCLFYLHPENREQMIAKLRQSAFNFPVCIDEDNVFYKLNRFPADTLFRTFLVNSENKIVYIGNPAEDPKVRERYLQRIMDTKPDPD